MICIHCGREIEDGARFCGFCGQSQTPVVQQGALGQAEAAPTFDPPAPERKSGRRHTARNIILIAAAVCLVAAAVVILASKGVFGDRGEKAREEKDLKNLLTAYSEAIEQHVNGAGDAVTIRVHFEQTRAGWTIDMDDLPFVLSEKSKPTAGDSDVIFVFSDKGKTVAYIGEKPKGITAYVPCTADELITALQSNARTARKTYKGKAVALSGYLRLIDDGGQFITLDNGDEESSAAIECRLKTSEQRREAASLAEGQVITVFGTITDVGETTGYTMSLDRFGTSTHDPVTPGGDDPVTPGEDPVSPGEDPVTPGEDPVDPIDDPVDPGTEEPPIDSRYDGFIVYGYSYREAVDQGWADEFEEIADQMSPDGSDTMSRYLAFIDGCDKRLFTREDLEGFSKEMAMMCRNAPFAHEGRKFDMEVIRTFFQKWKWYDGTIAPDDFQDSLLNGFEKANIDTVWAYEKEMGYQ